MPEPLNPKSHEISLDDAAAMTRRHRTQASVQGLRPLNDGDLGGGFGREAVLKLLSHPDCAYMRFYYGRNEKGHRHIVLVASDVNGNDLTASTATILEDHWMCPPWCPDANTSALRNDL